MLPILILPGMTTPDEFNNQFKFLESDRVPTFYSGPLDSVFGMELIPIFMPDIRDGIGIAGVAELAFGCIFGSTHCITWKFQFRSHVEMLLWRISAISLVVVPVLLILSILVVTILLRTIFNINGTSYVNETPSSDGGRMHSLRKLAYMIFVRLVVTIFWVSVYGTFIIAFFWRPCIRCIQNMSISTRIFIPSPSFLRCFANRSMDGVFS